MEKNEIKKEAIALIAELLEVFDFTFDLEVKTKPKGIRVFVELTQEQFENFINRKR